MSHEIESIQAIPVEIPLRKVFSGSGYRVASRNTVITRIRTAGGLASEVYNGDNRAHGRDIARIIQNELAPLLIGEDARHIERLWAQHVRSSACPTATASWLMEAIACVDTALWDLSANRRHQRTRLCLAASVIGCRLSRSPAITRRARRWPISAARWSG